MIKSHSVDESMAEERSFSHGERGLLQGKIWWFFNASRHPLGLFLSLGKIAEQKGKGLGIKNPSTQPKAKTKTQDVLIQFPSLGGFL